MDAIYRHKHVFKSRICALSQVQPQCSCLCRLADEHNPRAVLIGQSCCPARTTTTSTFAIAVPLSLQANYPLAFCVNTATITSVSSLYLCFASCRTRGNCQVLDAFQMYCCWASFLGVLFKGSLYAPCRV